MALNKTLIRLIVLVGAFAIITNPTVAQTRSPLLLVVSTAKGDHSLMIVDPLGGKVVGRVHIGEDPHRVAASPDGKFAFVTNSGGGGAKSVQDPGNNFSVIDVAAQKELRRINLGPGSRPHGIFFAGGKVCFTADGYKLIGCYDPGSNQVDWLLGIGQIHTAMIVVNKEANRIFTANTDSDNVTAIEPGSSATEWNLTVIPVGKEPHGIDISPEGKEVWTAHRGDGGVSIIDVTSKKVTRTINANTKSSDTLKFTPDGKMVLISDRDGELVVLDTTAQKEIKRMKVGKQLRDIVIAPDGSRAYVAVAGDNNVAIIDLTTLELAGRISAGNNPEGLAWVEMR